MTATENVFFDTAPLIYLIENHAEYYGKVEKLLILAEEQHWQLSTGVISIAEFGVKPAKENHQDVITALDQLLTDFQFQVLTIDVTTARRSYQLRARYEFLKAMDALQLATALTNGCTRFFTNDKKLTKVTDVEVTLVETF